MIAPALALCARLLASPAAGRACTCVGSLHDADAVARAQVVFVGRPLRSRTVTGPYGLPERIYTFAVSRWRKGGRGERIEVQTRMGGGDCGIVFRRGRTYMVYGNRTADGWVRTSLCDVPLDAQVPAEWRRR